MEEVKKMLEEARKLFSDLRAEQDKASAKAADQGQVSVEMAAKLAKIDADMQGKVEAAQKRWDEIERSVRRMEALGGAEPGSIPALVKECGTFNEGLQADLHMKRRGGSFQPLDIEAYKKYTAGFLAYARGLGNQLDQDMRAVMSVGYDPQQGYWVPPAILGITVEYQRDTSPLRDYAQVVTTGKDRVIVDHDLDEAGAERVGEVSTRTATARPKVGKSEITISELHARMSATQLELDVTDKDLQAWMGRKAGQKFARTENTEYVSGSKKLEARGFTTLTAGAPTAANFLRIEQVATGAAGAFKSAPNGPDIFKDLAGYLKTAYLPRAVWAMARLTLATARKLKDSNGQYQIMVGRDGRGRPGFMIEELPVAMFDDMPAIAANSLSIALADWFESYLIVDGTGMRMLVDPYSAKDSGEIEFDFWKRGSGFPKNTDAIKLAKFATSV